MSRTCLLIVLVAVGLANAVPLDILKGLASYNPEEVTDDFEMYIVNKGGDSRVTMVNEEAEWTIRFSEGFEAEKPANESNCYVRALAEGPLDDDCVQKIPLTPEEVPKAVLEECGGRQIFAMEPCMQEPQEEEWTGDEMSEGMSEGEGDAFEGSEEGLLEEYGEQEHGPFESEDEEAQEEGLLEEEDEEQRQHEPFESEDEEAQGEGLLGEDEGQEQHEPFEGEEEAPEEEYENPDFGGEPFGYNDHGSASDLNKFKGLFPGRFKKRDLDAGLSADLSHEQVNRMALRLESARDASLRKLDKRAEKPGLSIEGGLQVMAEKRDVDKRIDKRAI